MSTLTQRLFKAVRNNDASTLKKLLRTAGCVNQHQDYKHRSLLQRAIEVNAVDAARVLLEHGADANGEWESGRTHLHEAVYSLELVRLLLAHGAHTNAPCSNDNTAVLFAAAYGETSTLIELLRAGADPYHVANDGYSLVHWAVYGECFGNPHALENLKMVLVLGFPQRMVLAALDSARRMKTPQSVKLLERYLAAVSQAVLLT